MIVHRLKGLSGLGSRWTDVNGMNINLQMKDQWDLIVQIVGNIESPDSYHVSIIPYRTAVNQPIAVMSHSIA